jgi:uncharacterized protein YndB with AHSA1/START domain
MSGDTQKKNVVVTRVFDAPVAQVWNAWVDPGLVMQWWGPQGFTSPSAEMDVRVGGRSLVCMRAPQEFGGQDMYNTWTYSAIEPERRLEYILNFADKDGKKLHPAAMGLPAGVPADVLHAITFKPLDEGRTELTVAEYGYTSDQAHDISKAGMEQCLDKMQAALARHK